MPWGEIVRAGPPVPFPRGMVSDHISLVAPLVFLGAGVGGGVVLQVEGGALRAPDLVSASESPCVVASRVAHRYGTSNETGSGGRRRRTPWIGPCGFS